MATRFVIRRDGHTLPVGVIQHNEDDWTGVLAWALDSIGYVVVEYDPDVDGPYDPNDPDSSFEDWEQLNENTPT